MGFRLRWDVNIFGFFLFIFWYLMSASSFVVRWLSGVVVMFLSCLDKKSVYVLSMYL